MLLRGVYYIVIKHRNCLETWSKSGGVTITQGSSTDYDFTTSASQAYGSNLKLKGSKYCLYSGDCNQDGVVNSIDKLQIVSKLGNSGYIPEDINGNGFVNASDRSISVINLGKTKFHHKIKLNFHEKSFTASFILFLIFSFNYVNAQTGNLSITQTNDGSVIDINIYIKRTGAIPWNLGYASLVFNYNYNAMNTPVETAEGIWDNNSNAQYDDQTISFYNGNKCVSVEIGLSNVSTGTAVPTDSALAGKIRFNISDPLQNHDITWNTIYSSVLDNNGNDITSGITFNNPPNAQLPVELTSFNFNTSENNVYLHWTTSSELNNYGFEVYRKNSGNTQWQLAGFVPGNINSHQLINYEFADKSL
ncbi:MAG: hypothetical protein IPI04_10050 [Ignavibacteria bacterium]|nr:hypothetical protein [Ignavibacteria bacterium]